MSERAVPFYCPYCGEEDLRPVEEPHGAWRCAGCLRTFTVRMIGVGVPDAHPVAHGVTHHEVGTVSE